MSELREIVLKPGCVAKVGRCAEGTCVKTMLADTDHWLRLGQVIPWPGKNETIAEGLFPVITKVCDLRFYV